MTTFVYPDVAPGSGVPDDGAPTITVATPPARKYDPKTLAAVQLQSATATGDGALTVTFTVVTGEASFSSDGETGEYNEGSITIEGDAAAVNAKLSTVWLKPAAESTGTISYTVEIEDAAGKTANAGDPIQVVNSSLSNAGSTAKATVTVSGTSGSITLIVNGQPIMANVNFITDLSTTVSAIVTAMGAFTGRPKFKGTKIGTNQIKIEADLGFGDIANGFTVTATASGTMSISGDTKLGGGVPKVEAPSTLLDTLKKGAIDLIPTALGMGAAALALRMMSKAQVEVNVTSTDDKPDVSVIYDCQLISVPLGYVPAVMSDAGTFTTAATIPATWDYVTFEPEKKMCYNPVLCWLEMFKNKRWGTGSALPTTDAELIRLHKEVWKIIPRCDEMVKTGYFNPDGSKILEPRYAINTLINGMTKKEALEAVASVFDGLVVYGVDGTHIIADMPSTPKRVVTNANVGAGEFHLVTGSLSALYNQVDVEFNNPSNLYNLEKVGATDEQSNIDFGERKTSVRAFGCASEGQAKRKATMIMLTEKANPSMVSYVAGFDHCDVVIGDLVVVVENRVKPIGSKKAGGRIQSVVNSTTFVLDRPIQSDSDGYIYISMPDDTVASRKVTSISGNTVTVASAFPTTPAAPWVWIYNTSDLSDITYKVISRSEVAVGAYQISAIQYDATKYAKVDDF